MKESVRNTLFAAIVLAFIITVISSILGYIAMTNDFDSTLGYFEIGSMPAAMYLYLPLAVPVIALVCAFVIRKEFSIGAPASSGVFNIFTSVLTGLLMIGSGVLTCISGVALSKPAIGIVVSAFISGVCFIITPFLKNRPTTYLLALFPALWAAMNLIEEYFRDGAPINSPIRTVNLAMFAFLLLFFTEELRFGISKQLTGTYYFCILCGIAFTGSATLPKLAIIIMGKNDVFNFDLISWCLCAALFLFLLARLASLPSAFKPYKKPVKAQKREIPTGTAYIPNRDPYANGEDTWNVRIDKDKNDGDNK